MEWHHPTMESSSQAETSWRVSALYNRIFRPRPATRKIRKRESVPILRSASASSASPPTPPSTPPQTPPTPPPALPPSAATAAARDGEEEEEEEEKKEAFARYPYTSRAAARAISSSPSLPRSGIYSDHGVFHHLYGLVVFLSSYFLARSFGYVQGLGRCIQGFLFRG
ncbi:hypothetical protein F5Y14DRAFT_396088 [Nemania sp. NC0429]|nr:hypothetical protein F5Y14DRAFT_396088 [Nemania sp. NC0429]